MTTPEEITRIEQEIVLTLKNIYDPEIPVNIYDLGLVYEMADQLLEEVHDNVAKIKGITSVNVILTFEPPWDKSMISEESLLELGLL